MTWTWSNAPDDTTAAGRRDAVRFLVGDTDTTNQQVTDEVITWLLSENNNDVHLAAAQACTGLAGTYASKATTTKSVGQLSLSRDYSAQSTRWSERAAQLREDAMLRHPPSPKYYEDDDDNVFGPAQFTMGMHSNTGD